MDDVSLVGGAYTVWSSESFFSCRGGCVRTLSLSHSLSGKKFLVGRRPCRRPVLPVFPPSVTGRRKRNLIKSPLKNRKRLQTATGDPPKTTKEAGVKKRKLRATFHPAEESRHCGPPPFLFLVPPLRWGVLAAAAAGTEGSTLIPFFLPWRPSPFHPRFLLLLFFRVPAGPLPTLLLFSTKIGCEDQGGPMTPH